MDSAKYDVDKMWLHSGASACDETRENNKKRKNVKKRGNANNATVQIASGRLANYLFIVHVPSAVIDASKVHQTGDCKEEQTRFSYLSGFTGSIVKFWS